MAKKKDLKDLQEEFLLRYSDSLQSFKAELKKAKEHLDAWVLINQPRFELLAQESKEGLQASAIALVKGEAGREEAMALNTGDDTSTKVGFAIGMAEHDAFWLFVRTSVVGAKSLPTWLGPIIQAILGVLAGK